MYAVFATFHARPGARDAFLSALQPLVDAAASEEGTLLYMTHTSRRDPDRVWLYELYVDRDALKLHSASDVMAATQPAFEEHLVNPPEVVVTEVIGGLGPDGVVAAP